MKRIPALIALCLLMGAPFAGPTPTAMAAVASCRDNKGKFTTCPPPAAAKQKCRDNKGRFTACGAAAPTTAATPG